MKSPSSPSTSITPIRGSLLATLKGFPRPVWMIYLGMFINRFGTFVLPFLALHMTKEGYAPVEVSIAMGAYGVGHLVATLLGGYLADSMGRRNTIVLSMCSAAIVMLALSQADSFLSLVGLSCLAGMTSELYRPASSALLSDLVPVEDRVTAFAAYRFAINAGWAFGPATAGFLAEYSYFWLFVGDALTAATFGVIAFFGLPRLRSPRKDSPSNLSNPITELALGFRRAARDLAFLRVLAASALVAILFVQMMTTLGLSINAHGHPERAYGFVLGLNGLMIIVCEIPLSAWTRRYSPISVMAVGNLFVGLGVGIVAFASSMPVYCLAMAVFTVGEMVGMPIALAHISHLAPADMRGRYMGIYGLTWALSLTLGPSVGMLGFRYFPFWFWIGCGALGLVSVLVLLLPEKRPMGAVINRSKFAPDGNRC